MNHFGISNKKETPNGKKRNSDVLFDLVTPSARLGWKN